MANASFYPAMSVLVARALSIHKAIAVELQRFALLWRYQHPVMPYTLAWRLVVKSLIDRTLAALILAVVAPVMALIALAVKLDSRGPAIYAQERVGRFGELFKIYKFRSMRVDAEANGAVWSAGQEDPRLTRIGRILRRTHLDELPQLWNVIQGDMSLVGPRPERPQFVHQLVREVPKYDDRLLIKPGMTGLAQVHYRYDQTIADVKRKVRFDVLYIKRMCPILDARILAWTVLVVMTGRGIR